MSDLIIAGIALSLLFIADSCWHLRIAEFSFLGRQNPYGEITAVLSWAFLLISLTLHRHRRYPARYSYLSIVVFTFVSVAFSFLASSVPCYGQSPAALGSTLFWFGGVTAYVALMNLKPIALTTADKIYRGLVWYGVAACILLISASFAPPIRALFPDVVSERGGLVRMAGVAELMLELCFAHFLGDVVFPAATDAERPFRRIGGVLGLLASTYVIFFVSVTRQNMFAVLMLVAVTIVGCACNRRKQIAVTLLLLVSLAVLVPSLTTGEGKQSFLARIIFSLDPTGTSTDNRNVSIRMNGIRFYWNELVNSDFVGIGWISTADDAPANSITDAIHKQKFLLSDLGAFQVLVQFGLLGIVIWIAFLCKTGRRVWDLLRRGSEEDRRVGFTIGGFFLVEAARFSHLFYWPEFAIHYGILMYILDVRHQHLSRKMCNRYPRGKSFWARFLAGPNGGCWERTTNRGAAMARLTPSAEGKTLVR